jgi:hypothetical protein
MYLFVVYLTMPSVILVTPRKITRRLCNVNWKRYKNHSLIWVSRNIDKFSWIDWGKPRRTLVRIFDVPAEIRKKTLPENKNNTSWVKLLSQYNLYEEQVRHLWTVTWLNAQVEAWVCGRSLAGIAGSNSAEVMDVRPVVFVACCVGSDHCYGLITGSE